MRTLQSSPRVPSLALVVLVGRPNVGKSTLFNRITGTRRSIVTPVAGTTRDVIAQTVQWQSVSFTLLDTGGMFGATEDPLQLMVAEKGKEAITRADLLVVVLDGQHGLVPGDLDIVQQLRASGAPILAVVNKIDAKKAREATMQFYELGIDPMFEVSAEHGLGISDLLDEIAHAASQGPPSRRRRRRARRRAARSAAERGVHRRHRASERRQVVPGQPVAARGADAGERDAGHDPRCRGHAAEVAQTRLPHRRHRRASVARAGWRPAGRWSR